MKSKECRKCKQVKNISDFSKSKNSKDNLQAECRVCNKEWRVAYYIKYPERNRKRSIKNNYGATMEWLEEKYNNQKGCCDICGSFIKLFAVKKEESIEVARVDHDHVTEELRGLLCNKCNVGLGHFKDNISNLKRAISYLERYKKDD